MKYIEAPNYDLEIARLHPNGNNLFLAGSITGAQDWQKELAFKEYSLLEFGSNRLPTRLVDHFNVFNPRRINFDASNPVVELEQITWEYHCIHQCKYILFWFAPETLAPITLFELGSALNTHEHKDIFIGIDPEYKRKNDVIIQTSLRSKDLANRIVFSKDELAKQVLKSRI